VTAASGSAARVTSLWP